MMPVISENKDQKSCHQYFKKKWWNILGHQGCPRSGGQQQIQVLNTQAKIHYGG